MEEKTKDYLREFGDGIIATFMLIFIFLMWWGKLMWQFMNWIHNKIKSRLDAKK